MSENRDELLRARAYALWEAEGRPEGRDQDHWAAAEAELVAQPIPEALDPAPAKAGRKPRAAPATPRKRKVSPRPAA